MNTEWHEKYYKCYCKPCRERRGDYMTLDLNDILKVRKMPYEEERYLNMTIKVLKEQVEVFTSRLEPHDTGHLHTTISTLTHRITELQNEKETGRQTREEGMEKT